MKREISPAIAIGVVVAVLLVIAAFLWLKPSSSNGGIPDQRLRAARQRLEAGLPQRGAPVAGNRYAAPGAPGAAAAPGATSAPGSQP